MKIFDAKTIREIDAYTIENTPISSIDLMEKAARTIFEFIINHYPKETEFYVFAGEGNNGGDAFALARMLLLVNYKVHIFAVFPSNNLSPDCKKNYEQLLNINYPIILLNSDLDFPKIEENAIIVDGLLGSGLNRPLSGIYAFVVEKINEAKVEIVAIDIPSGLYSDYLNTENNVAIKATYTISFQFPKLIFMLPESEPFVGKFILTDIGLDKDYIEQKKSPFNYVTIEESKKLLKKRVHFAHKGNFGHALLITGSYGKMGAAILSAKACLRSGTGLVSVYSARGGNNILQTSIPEAMFISDKNGKIITRIPKETDEYTVIGCGCGIGKQKRTAKAIKRLLIYTNKPLILDADALNIIAENEWQKLIPKNSIITPHPKEFERLTGKVSSSLERLEKAIEFARKLEIIVILKGANTAIILPTGKVFFNSTGNSGMATAGSGDVLTGIITGLVAQKYSPSEAAILGVYLHGLAGDMALKNNSQESLLARDIIENICEAYSLLHQ